MLTDKEVGGSNAKYFLRQLSNKFSNIGERWGGGGGVGISASIWVPLIQSLKRSAALTKLEVLLSEAHSYSRVT